MVSPHHRKPGFSSIDSAFEFISYSCYWTSLYFLANTVVQHHHLLLLPLQYFMVYFSKFCVIYNNSEFFSLLFHVFIPASAQEGGLSIWGNLPHKYFKSKIKYLMTKRKFTMFQEQIKNKYTDKKQVRSTVLHLTGMTHLSTYNSYVWDEFVLL